METVNVSRDWEEIYAQKSTPWDMNQPEEELVNLIKNKIIIPCKALELGCGHGNDAIFLAKNNFEVTAVDISEKAITEAKRRAESAGVKVNFLVGDACELSELEEKFHFIYDRACFHFIPLEKRKSYVENVGKLLTKKGYFVLIVSSDQDKVKGPYRFSKQDIQNIFSEEFEVIEMKLIILQQHQEKPTPYFCLMKRK